MATGVVSIEQNTNLAQSGTSYVSCASFCRLERLAIGWLLASWLCSNGTIWLLSSYACICDRCQIVIFQNCATASSTSQSKEVFCSGTCKAVFGGQSWTLDSRCIIVCHTTPSSTGSHHISAVRCDWSPSTPLLARLEGIFPLFSVECACVVKSSQLKTLVQIPLKSHF